ncbi:MAG: DUF4256 domain-containing protein [Tissierellia bacterium]|nr:DUF4256 domain-containing protein [Tissierellia bacterium]
MDVITILKNRIKENNYLNQEINWNDLEQRLSHNPDINNSLLQMEESGGKPNIVKYHEGKYIFFDCSKETPTGRRSLCYDDEALISRAKNKPIGSALKMAEIIGIEILNEDDYRFLQTLGEFDTKTLSWIKTPNEIRTLGGALFCDRRYNTVFTYHNGAESYYSSRGFRGKLSI